jgi:hypothetical protein
VEHVLDSPSAELIVGYDGELRTAPRGLATRSAGSRIEICSVEPTLKISPENSVASISPMSAWIASARRDARADGGGQVVDDVALVHELTDHGGLEHGLDDQMEVWSSLRSASFSNEPVETSSRA